MTADENGELDVKMPEEYVREFRTPVDWTYVPVLGEAKRYGRDTFELDSFETCTYGFFDHKEDSFFFQCTIVPREVYDYFGILLKSDKEASGCLLLEFDMAMQRVSLLDLPMDADPFWRQSCQAVPDASDPGPEGVRVAEKTFAIEQGKAIDIKIVVEKDLIEVFAGEQVAFTHHIYRKPEFEVGIIAQDARVEFCNVKIAKE